MQPSHRKIFFPSHRHVRALDPTAGSGRNRLLTNPDGRRAAVAVTGVVMVVIPSMGCAAVQRLPSSIIVVDPFILGVGIATTPPTIRYGRQLGRSVFWWVLSTTFIRSLSGWAAC